MKTYVYFVSYQFNDGGSWGFGNIEMIANKLITTSEQIRNAEQNIDRVIGNGKTVILNFTLLREKETDESESD